MNKSKYQLVFKTVGIMEQLRLRCEEHYQKYNVFPRKIYLPLKEYIQYRDLIPKMILNPHDWENFDCDIGYRGVKVIRIKGR